MFRRETRERTELTCITPPGTARDNIVRVHVGITQGLSHENATYHYRIPYVHCVDFANGELFGGDTIQVLGRDFGKQSQQAKAFIGGVPCQQTVYISEHHLECVVPAAWGKTDYRNKSVVVTALDMSSPGERHATHFTYSGGFNHIFSYDDMHITGMNVREGPTYGYNKVEITGTHIGRVDAPAQPHVYIGGKPCMDTTVLSTDVLECTVPGGVGVNVGVHSIFCTSIEALVLPTRTIHQKFSK